MTAGHVLYSPQYGNTFMPDNDAWYHESNWARLMKDLQRRFRRARVAVFPAAPLQIPVTA